MFISGRQARHALRSGDEGVLAWVSVEDGIGKEPPDKSTQNEHPDLKTMFRDYDDLFPDDLPARLPPERSVDHEIRITPIATCLSPAQARNGRIAETAHRTLEKGFRRTK